MSRRSSSSVFPFLLMMFCVNMMVLNILNMQTTSNLRRSQEAARRHQARIAEESSSALKPSNLKPRADIARILDYMRNPKNERFVMLRKEYKEGSVQIVFRRGGSRYTLYLSVMDHKFLSVWVRPEGTTGQARLATFTDQNLDGSVDFGLQAPAQSKQSKLFDNGNLIGREHERYWQQHYDKAIVAIEQEFGLSTRKS